MCLNIQAVTACNRDRFFRIILRKLPSPLPPLSKGGGLTAWHKPLLYSVLLAIPPPFLFTELFCRQDGGIALRQQNYFNRRNLQWLSAAGRIWSGTLPQKTVTEYHRDRLFRIILRKLPSPLPPLSKGGGLTAWHKPLLYSVLLAIPPPFLFTELFCRQDGGIALRQQNYFNRRNLQWLSATGGT